MTRLWSEEYMSEESDDETYGPRQPGKEKSSKSNTTGGTDSMSMLAEGARLSCCQGYGAADAAGATSEPWLPDCCAGGGAATARGAVESSPTWGSYTTTGDQTEKQAAAFAASVEQASREADAAGTEASTVNLDEPLLADETPLSDDTTADAAAAVDFEEDASLEVTQDGGPLEETSVAPFDESADANAKSAAEQRRTRTGFGLMMAGMFPRLGSGGSRSRGGSDQNMLAVSSASGEEITRDLENTERMMAASASADASTECTGNGTSPGGVAAAGVAGAGALAAAAAVVANRKNKKGSSKDASEEDTMSLTRDYSNQNYEGTSPVRSGVDPSVDGTAASGRYGPGYADLVPISNEKDVESGVGSTKGSVEDDSYEVDDDSEDVFIEKNPRGRACGHCCLCLLVLMLLAGVGAFLGTGFAFPGFLKQESTESQDTSNNAGERETTLPGETEVTTEGSDDAGPTLTTGQTVYAPVPETDTTEGGPGNTEAPGSTSLGEGPAPVKFGMISDSPLDDPMALALQSSLEEIDASFVLHVGNVRDGDKVTCELQDYQRTASVLATSTVPVWVLPGPSDWSLCENPVEGQNLYEEQFVSFAVDNWDVSMPFRQPERPNNFAWEASDNLLLVGLNFLEADRVGTVGEIFAWTRAVVENFDGEHVVIASYSIPTEYMSLMETLELPSILYIQGKRGEARAVNPVLSAIDTLTYTTV